MRTSATTTTAPPVQASPWLRERLELPSFSRPVSRLHVLSVAGGATLLAGGIGAAFGYSFRAGHPASLFLAGLGATVMGAAFLGDVRRCFS